MTNSLVTGRDRVSASMPREDAPTVETAWDILERFGQSLQGCDAAAQQVRLVLTAVRDGLGADVVFWHPGVTADEFQTIGTPVLSLAWCRAFMDHVLADVPPEQGQALFSFLDPGAKPIAPWPAGAAMVRLSRTRQVWLGALSFCQRRVFRSVDIKVMMLARRMLLNHRHQARTHGRLRDSLFGFVRCLAAAIDAKDPFTWGHSERVARIAVRLGQQMGVPTPFLSDLYLAGILHDIGKIGIRDDVLQKQGKLTPAELEHVQEHPMIGDRMIANVAALQYLRSGVRHHHERWDGQGYPDRLAGEQTSLLARVLAVADSCDAMSAARPYRAAMPPERIDAEIRSGAGSQWDPRIVEHFLACRHDLYSICQRGLGESVNVAIERALNVGRGEE